MRLEDWDLWKRVSSTVRRFGDSSAPASAPVLHWLPFKDTSFAAPLDLHGLTLPTAYLECARYIRQARIDGHKRVTIITGRSGNIRKEFPEWMSRIQGVRDWHVLKNDGSFSVHLRG